MRVWFNANFLLVLDKYYNHVDMIITMMSTDINITKITPQKLVIKTRNSKIT